MILEKYLPFPREIIDEIKKFWSPLVIKYRYLRLCDYEKDQDYHKEIQFQHKLMEETPRDADYVLLDVFEYCGFHIKVKNIISEVRKNKNWMFVRPRYILE